MAKSARQQEKLIRLREILLAETDEEHGVTMEEILARLRGFGISAERKSIYENIGTLNDCGMDIVCERRGGKAYYAAVNRDFEQAELHLLADAVAGSRFITARKSDLLLKKIGGLASRRQAALIRRQVRIPGRIKNMNETIFYAVDKLHSAMAKERAVSFQYAEWVLENRTPQRRPRHSGRVYTVSPWQLLWEEDYYYLVAFDHAAGAIRHYRVDRMSGLKKLAEPRQGKAAFDAIGIEQYAARVFGMFGGKPERVVLRFSPELLGAMIDRFGREARFVRAGDRLEIRTDVVPSAPFFGWLTSFEGRVQIASPEELKEKYRFFLKKSMGE